MELPGHRTFSIMLSKSIQNSPEREFLEQKAFSDEGRLPILVEEYTMPHGTSVFYRVVIDVNFVTIRQIPASASLNLESEFFKMLSVEFQYPLSWIRNLIESARLYQITLRTGESFLYIQSFDADYAEIRLLGEAKTTDMVN